MRAISALKRDAGTSTRWWRACTALRILVSMSAIGSVMVCPLPTALNHARHFATKCELAEAQTAQRELAQIRARPAALAAPIPMPNRELRLLLVLDGLCGCRHICGRFAPELRSSNFEVRS